MVCLIIIVVANNKLLSGYVPPWFPIADYFILGANFFAATNILWIDIPVFNDPSWSVSVEIFVSVFLLYWLAFYRMVNLTMILSICAYLFLFATAGFELRSAGFEFGINAGLLRGIGGILLGYCVYEKNISFTAPRLFIFVLFISLLTILYFSHGSLDLFGILIFLCLLASLRGSDEFWLISNPLFSWLGSVSYSLYLMHTFLIYLLAPAQWIPNLSWFTAPFVFLVSLAFAAIFTYGFEKPTREFAYRLIPRVFK
jgi:peptidoglycan/LPS O-acetylase OafA/YrhL